MQEVIVASSLKLVDGDSYISHEAVEIASRGLVRYPHISMQDSNAIDNARRFLFMCNIRKRYQDREQLSLMEILSIFQNSNASDLRDKVFALKGITNAESDSLPRIDYSSDKASVLCETVRCLIGRGQYFQAIHAAGIGWRDASSDIPSWIPDWTLSPAWPAAFTLSNFDPQRTFSSSYQHQSDISLSSNYSEWTITGQEVDRIAHLSIPLKLMGNEQISNHDVLRSWLIDCKRMVAQNSLLHYAGEQARGEAFWRTLIVDKDDRGEFATAALSKCFVGILTQSTI